MQLENYSKIDSIEALHARIDNLGATLVWGQVRTGLWQLVSTTSHRILDTVVAIEGDQYGVGQVGSRRDTQYRDIFTSLEAAQEYAKFSTIKSIVQDDLGRRHIQ